MHDKAALAMQASEAAGIQGKFWEMHDLLFARPEEWYGLSVDEFKDWIIGRAAELSIDPQKFSTDLYSEKLVNMAEEAWEKNVAKGMTGTPLILINDRQYGGLSDYANLEAVVRLVLLEKRQFSECPPMTIDSKKQYLAILRTEKGDITLELYADKAPLAVNNFIFLARQGWYNGVTFHRVIPGFVAQAGDPSGTGFGGPGYGFDNEISSRLSFDGPGVVGMANAGPGSNGSQFFITLAAASHLSGSYTIFGRVIAGIDVVESLTSRDPSKTIDLPPGDKIISVTIEEK